LQLVSEPVGAPQSAGQLHGSSQALQVPFPQHIDWLKQSESGQSTAPSQSLSRPSVQLISEAAGGPQSDGQLQ
jgi:hypothetical protein